MRVLVFLYLLPLCYSWPWDRLVGWVQSAGASVTFRCNGKPFTNARVTMMDAEPLPGDDDAIGGSVESDKFGKAKVEGSAREISQIEPYLFIEHDCIGMPWRFCLFLPPEFVNYGPKAKKYWHIKVELSDFDWMFKKRCRFDIYPGDPIPSR
ncbi:unnamed protein product [Cylicocyclus nassatus]|uniref:Uncharacterized protein n=1 Tax=Cylicocyclus nassatus TaxID=53992 RepID=A0AA36HD68_CYLNA|nr:unnamed protein product [Cylicocyclus nassatus]